MPAIRTGPIPPGAHSSELENLEAGELVRRARRIDEFSWRLTHADRIALVSQWRELAKDLELSALRLERERPDPDFIPPYVRRGPSDQHFAHAPSVLYLGSDDLDRHLNRIRFERWNRARY